MVRSLSIGLDEALKLTLENINPMSPAHTIDLLNSVGRIVFKDLFAKVDSPSADVSKKDGYAIISSEIAHATSKKTVRLKLAGSVAAGDHKEISVSPGMSVRVLTGARIPPGANAVVSDEYVQTDGKEIVVTTFSEPGRNILPKGIDVAPGEYIARKGNRLTPGLIGLLAAAGYNKIPVFPNPNVAIISTGDEVVAPGEPLPDGKLYASNMTTLNAWCQRYGMGTDTTIVKDDPDEIFNVLNNMLTQADAIVTSGGAWNGDRDLVISILERLGWKQVFHTIRIGPGKAVGFGLLTGKPVFILPGGPPSNLMSFLQIALPGLLKLAGYPSPALPKINVRLACDLAGAYADWTQIIYGDLEMQSDLPLFHPLINRSRLGSMADAKAIVAITEGLTLLPKGSIVNAQLLV